MPMQWYLKFRFLRHDEKEDSVIRDHCTCKDSDNEEIDNDESRTNVKKWTQVDPIITQCWTAQDAIREMFSCCEVKIFLLDDLIALFTKKLEENGGALNIFAEPDRFEFGFEDLKMLGIIINAMKQNKQTKIVIKATYG